MDIIEICPVCGYVQMSNIEVTDEIIELVKSDVYRNILTNADLPIVYKKWILMSFIYRKLEYFTEAAIALTKTYDYLEINNLTPNQDILKEALNLFVEEVRNEGFWIPAIMAVDTFRRLGEFEEAEKLLDETIRIFKDDVETEVIEKEKLYISIKDDGKKIIFQSY